ncbi:amino acid ABC transporter permease [Cryobacterium sp. M91]|uniref:amino acid ABC transporter permease n=1 Tax=Cryobacterium sp. M91 TaxID=2048294 RepID=UPI001E3BB310|nr:amino acid ABC transporter permease [Cryobacterium sp. M91]
MMTLPSTSTQAMTSEQSADGGRIIPVSHPGQWIGVAAILVAVALFVQFLVTNEKLRLDLVAGYLFERSVMRGLVLTLELTVVAMILGIVLGTLLAIMRLSGNRVLSFVASGYIWFFRGTPILVQLLFWFFLGSILPVINLGIPFGPTLVEIPTNVLISQFTAAILGLGLNEAAYMAEIIRAGIKSVDPGQSEAAEAVGMSRMLAYRRVILPQASRVVLPPIANNTISMLKLSSLVIVVGLPELLTAVQLIYSRNFQQIPLLIVASIWYLLLTTILTIIQVRIERRLDRSVTGPRPVIRAAERQGTPS